MKNKFYSNFGTLVVVISVLFLTSCSVFMAANKSGVSLEQLSACKIRECLLSNGATPISSKKNKSGTLVEEIYKAKKPTGSAARAAMHGVLDVATLGIWEVAGTPIEGTMNKDEVYILKVLYKDNGEDIKAIQLAQ